MSLLFCHHKELHCILPQESANHESGTISIRKRGHLARHLERKRARCPHSRLSLRQTSVVAAFSILLQMTTLFALATDTPALNPAADPQPREEDWCVAQHQSLNQKALRGGFDVMMLGDSVTWEWDADGWEGNKNTGLAVWPQLAKLRPATFAVSGDRTEHLLWRLQNGNLEVPTPPKTVVLLIGPNNIRQREDRPEEVAAGIEKILKTVQAKFPQTKILVYGILPPGKLPEDAPRKAASATNELIRQLADGKRVRYVNIEAAFLDENGHQIDEMFRDGLHLSQKGYEAWAKSLLQEIP